MSLNIENLYRNISSLSGDANAALKIDDLTKNNVVQLPSDKSTTQNVRQALYQALADNFKGTDFLNDLKNRLLGTETQPATQDLTRAEARKILDLVRVSTVSLNARLSDTLKVTKFRPEVVALLSKTIREQAHNPVVVNFLAKGGTRDLSGLAKLAALAVKANENNANQDNLFALSYLRGFGHTELESKDVALVDKEEQVFKDAERDDAKILGTEDYNREAAFQGEDKKQETKGISDNRNNVSNDKKSENLIENKGNEIPNTINNRNNNVPITTTVNDNEKKINEEKDENKINEETNETKNIKNETNKNVDESKKLETNVGKQTVPGKNGSIEKNGQKNPVEGGDEIPENVEDDKSKTTSTKSKEEKTVEKNGDETKIVNPEIKGKETVLTNGQKEVNKNENKGGVPAETVNKDEQQVKSEAPETKPPTKFQKFTGAMKNAFGTVKGAFVSLGGKIKGLFARKPVKETDVLIKSEETDAKPPKPEETAPKPPTKFQKFTGVLKNAFGTVKGAFVSLGGKIKGLFTKTPPKTEGEKTGETTERPTLSKEKGTSINDSRDSNASTVSGPSPALLSKSNLAYPALKGLVLGNGMDEKDVKAYIGYGKIKQGDFVSKQLFTSTFNAFVQLMQKAHNGEDDGSTALLTKAYNAVSENDRKTVQVKDVIAKAWELHSAFARKVDLKGVPKKSLDTNAQGLDDKDIKSGTLNAKTLYTQSKGANTCYMFSFINAVNFAAGKEDKANFMTKLQTISAIKFTGQLKSLQQAEQGVLKQSNRVQATPIEWRVHYEMLRTAGKLENQVGTIFPNLKAEDCLGKYHPVVDLAKLFGYKPEQAGFESGAPDKTQGAHEALHLAAEGLKAKKPVVLLMNQHFVAVTGIGEKNGQYEFLIADSLNPGRKSISFSDFSQCGGAASIYVFDKETE